MDKITKLKKVIKSEINEQFKRVRPDLSKIENSFTEWLQKNLKNIEHQQLQNNPNELIDFLNNARNDGVHVSPTYLDKIAKNIRNLKYPRKILQYLYNVYLKGSALGLDEVKRKKTKKI